MSHREAVIAQFGAMCEAVGSDYTESQKDRLCSWALENFGPADFMLAGEIALQHGIGDLYTDFSMRAGEMGL